jgi:hypothetical protein
VFGLHYGRPSFYIESRALCTVDQTKERFRSFLLASFQNFSAMERRRASTEKRGGRAQMIRIDWQNAEVAQTVLNPNDIDAEVHALCDALVQAEGRVWV